MQKGSKEHLLVTVNNWAKFNPRKAQKHYTWLRLDHAVMTDPQFSHLTSEGLFTWMATLCYAAYKGVLIDGHMAFLVPVDEFSRYCRLSPELVCTVLHALALTGAIDCERVLGDETERLRVLSLFIADAREAARRRTSSHEDETERATQCEDETNETRRDETKKENRPPPPDLLSLWNDHCSERLTRALTFGAKRQRAWRVRWLEKPDLYYWVGVVERLSNSPFCCGQNDRGWRADIEFLLKADTHVKVMEGKYDSRNAGSTSVNRSLWEKVERGEA